MTSTPSARPCRSEGGEVYTDSCDCNFRNVCNKIVAHLIRMAFSRVKARVVRDFCNIGIS